jgi:ectoine hydroxylase-related dioxygenase (phytanoyl-CoA dioxygenase family)
VQAGLDAEVAEFWRLGFVVVRGVFERAEMAVLKEIVDGNAAMASHAAKPEVHVGGASRQSFNTLFVWNDTGGRDAFSKVTRSWRIVDRLQAYFRDEVYVYHNKVALKFPGVVGFSYHQDYAYWYQMGNLFPDMASAFVAIDPATMANGCLKVIAGSHRLGRLDHVQRGGIADSGVDPERLAQIQKVMPAYAIELGVGDMIIFHCNTLHGSDDNLSGESRIALLGCYNTKHNSPYKSVFGHPAYQSHERIGEPVTAADRDNLPDFTRG